METSPSKNKRFAEISIVVIVLICVGLILLNTTVILIDEFKYKVSQPVVVEGTAAPTPGGRPTYPPDYTPEPVQLR